jgi:saccharopine dehydrogenase-like NADP-dependent oxidoreductase
VDYRDLATGLMAMNRTVGFAASIAAQMIVSGRIRGKGLLSPANDVPYADFAAELAKRGMTVHESWTPPG